MSVDPVLTDNNTGASFNRYVYANNSPYRYIDPDGRQYKAIFEVIKAIVKTEAKAAPKQAQEAAKGAAKAEAKAVEKAAVKEGPKAETKEAAKNSAPTEKEFSKDKQALVDMAKNDKKSGITKEDMEAYKELNKGLRDPFPANKVRGPEAHQSGAPSSQAPHGHVGPVGHIPVIIP